MKKRKISIVILLASFIMIALYLGRENNRMMINQTPFSKKSVSELPLHMVVATDLHYLSSELTDYGSFFTKMVNSADGKNMYYIEQITDAFVDTILEEKPEILILSGDLTFNGEKKSHLELKEKLEKIQNNGTQILVIPGNHDIDRSSAASFFGDSYQFVDSVSSEEFSKIYNEFGLHDSLQKDDNSLSYVYKVRSDFWILLLDTNSKHTNYLSKNSLKWVEETLKQAKAEGSKVLAVSHQNVFVHNPYFRDGFVIHHADELEELYKKYQVIANLSGHIHIQHIEQTRFPEILTSALSVSPHQYGKLTIDGEKLDYHAQSIDVKKWALKIGNEDPVLQDFAVQSRNFMEKVAKSKAEDDLLDTKLTVVEKTLLLDTFAKLNADYFAGLEVRQEDYQMGIQLWNEKGLNFYNRYLESLLDSTQKDYLNLILEIE